MKIKGFDKNLQCKKYQFEVGKEYKIDSKELKLCSNTVFHYCDSIQKVHKFYNCAYNNRYCEIEVLGDEVTDGKQCGSNHIRIIREIVGEELDFLLGRINGNTGLFNSGIMNSGNWNSGDWNSGIMNSCDYSNGVFNSIEDENIKIFNKPSGMSLHTFLNSKYYDALYSAPFILTEWVEYTDEEKKEDINKTFTEGYLKTYTYKEACANWWNLMTNENKEIVMSIPNFDKEVFKKITSIKL